jgi:dTDP-4-amino-4,6-dideoxygalactose transaminase
VGELTVADQIMGHAFFLGVFPGLDTPRLDYMIDQVRRFLEQF